MAVRFSQDTNLQSLIDDGSISQVVRLVGLSTITLETWRFRYDSATFTLTIDFTTDGFGGNRATFLADGRYRIQLDTRLITAAAAPGQHLADDDILDDSYRTIHFHRLLADFDGDADVDLVDRDLLFQHYGPALEDPLQFAFDLTGDGRVDNSDYLQWKKRYGRRL